MHNSDDMSALHPLTHIVIAVELSIVLFILPLLSAFILITVMFATVLLLPRRSDTRLTAACIKLLMIAAVFLLLLHGISYNPPGISDNLLAVVLPSFLRIATPVTAVLYLSRLITPEEFFALCLDLRLPPSVIVILFRTIWLVPRLIERMDEVVIAQKLRGIAIRTPFQRMKAIIPTISTIFSSMVEETSENALVLTTRAFLLPGPKSHVTRLNFRVFDIVIISLTTSILVLVCF